jgi:hypothetical protein
VRAPSFLKDVLDLGERLLDGIKLGRVGGHEYQLCSPRFNELPYPLGSVRPEALSITTTCPSVSEGAKKCST